MSSFQLDLGAMRHAFPTTLMLYVCYEKLKDSGQMVKSELTKLLGLIWEREWILKN